MNLRVAIGEAGPSAAKAWLRALEMTAPIAAHPTRTLPAIIDDLAEAHGDAPALLSDREALSYRTLAARANRYARWALAQGLAKGDTVGLLMPNRPEYMAAWLGITRVGGVVSLLNTNLAGRSLAHCIEVAAPRQIIVAAELAGALAGALPHLSFRPGLWAHGDAGADFARLDLDLERHAAARLDRSERRTVTIDDTALHIYTSGTTGLPKAAKVSHARVMMWSHWFAGMMDTRPSDRMYDCLPMYHSVGGVVATGAMLVTGGSVLIRDKFSARQLWDDVVRQDCTLVQYIGELCRYLTNAPPHPLETKHRLRLACGNGLRPDVWETFKSRFAIPHILEFYAATEGNLSLYNAEGKPGAIGRVPPFLAHRFPAAIVKSDAGSGEPLRDERGLCIPCAPMRSARRSAESSPTIPAAASTAIPTRGIRKRRCCATCSSPATPGFAPATSCAGTSRAISISSTASAIPSGGRGRMWRRRKSATRSRAARASWMPPCMGLRCRRRMGASAWRRWSSPTRSISTSYVAI